MFPEDSSLPPRKPLPATLYATGFSLRKRRFVRQFLHGSTVHFIRNASRLPPHAPLVVWGSRPVPAAVRESSGDLIRLEDGFLRSVGLGAGLARPLSWVMDFRGIYYDSTQPSDLEDLLATTEFSSGMLARAARLREKIVASGVTKYNLDLQPWRRPEGSRKIILVAGQVENDASLRYGAPDIRTNLDLLKAVRGANPDAYLVYKPHPDVVAGLRAGGAGEDQAFRWCDEVLAGAPMGQLLLDVDEVHVITSLAGFEALLRGRAVTCHGQPFFAGWGLTRDMAPISRRTRRLSLDALVAGALILYPIYISRATGLPATPEQVLEELRQWRLETTLRKPGPVRRQLTRLFSTFLRKIEARAMEKMNRI